MEVITMAVVAILIGLCAIVLVYLAMFVALGVAFFVASRF